MIAFWNWWALVGTLAMVGIGYWWWTMNRAPGTLVFTFGFVWWFALKVLVQIQVPWVDHNSRPLSAGMVTLMVVGLLLHVRGLYQFGRSNGNGNGTYEQARQRDAISQEREGVVQEREDTAQRRAETVQHREDVASHREDAVREAEKHTGNGEGK